MFQTWKIYNAPPLNVIVSASEVCGLLRVLDSNKACGPDLLPARLLKEGADEISYSISKVFNLSLAFCLKTEPLLTLFPIHKKNDKCIIILLTTDLLILPSL